MPYQDVYDQVRAADIARDQAIKDNAFQNSQYAYTLQQQGARRQAGNAFASGDIPGAAQTLYQAGDIAGGQQAQQYDDATRQKHAQAALRISQGIRAATAAGHTPQEAFAMATQIAPQLGIDPKDLANMKPAFDQNPQAFLDMVDQQAKKDLQFFQTKGGIYAGDKATGRVTKSVGFPGEPIAIDPAKNYYLPDDGSTQASAATPTVQGAQGQPATPNADAVWQAMIQRESGGQPGVKGPMTPYGQAIGATQLLPKTAKAMADKLGLPFRMDLLTGTSPQAAAYQEQLGRAYFDEGLQKYGGDVGKAAMYYHGGPNEAIWGPKTRAYAQAVTAGQPMAGGAGADTVGAPQIPGYRLIQKASGADKKSKWDIYVDPKTNTPYRYNSATAEATTIDGKPYTPSGLAKVSGGGTPRSAAALAVQRFVQEHPEATAEGISQFNANLNKERSATTAFGTGKQGQTINSLNVSIDHLNTLSNLAGALGNGDVKLLNRWSQQWKAQTGNPAPTNFIAAKQIVGDEIVKGIVGAGGGVADREKAQAAISEASSPAQLAGVIGTYKHLLAGQLNGLRLQYKNTTGRADFEDKLLPATRGELEGVGPTARTAPPRNRPPLSAIFR